MSEIGVMFVLMILVFIGEEQKGHVCNCVIQVELRPYDTVFVTGGKPYH